MWNVADLNLLSKKHNSDCLEQKESYKFFYDNISVVHRISVFHCGCEYINNMWDK